MDEWVVGHREVSSTWCFRSSHGQMDGWMSWGEVDDGGIDLRVDDGERVSRLSNGFPPRPC